MQQEQTNDLGFCPSFSCYTSDSLASTAAGRISYQLQQEQAVRFLDVDEKEFEFSVVLGDEELSDGVINSDGRTGFPFYNRDTLIQNDVDRHRVHGKADEEEMKCSDTLEKFFINEREESDSSSSNESDVESPGVFCVWKSKLESGSSSPISKCKKSRSAGSGSKRWRIRDLLRRSSSEVKEPMLLLTDKKLEISKQRSSEGSIVTRRSRPSSQSIHELFYVQQRAKSEDGKRKSYLPYRQGLLGFFSNVNGSSTK